VVQQVPRAGGEFAHQFVQGRQFRVEEQNLAENRRLIANVLVDGR
jgi:hypothetical protein